MKDTVNNRNAITIWHYLKEHPEAGYTELEQQIECPEGKPNYVNALIKKLQRGGYLEIERQRDTGGRITSSFKKCVKEPRIIH